LFLEGRFASRLFEIPLGPCCLQLILLDSTTNERIEIEIEPQQYHPKQLGWLNHRGIVVGTTNSINQQEVPMDAVLIVMSLFP
jgi:hypothetical protein